MIDKETDATPQVFTLESVAFSGTMHFFLLRAKNYTIFIYNRI